MVIHEFGVKEHILYCILHIWCLVEHFFFFFLSKEHAVFMKIFFKK